MAMNKTALTCTVLALGTVLTASECQAQGVSFLPARNFDVGSQPRSLAVGDFNGDGLADLAVANYGSGDVSVLLGTGDGTFESALNFAVGRFPSSVAVGDFNGDGLADLAVVTASLPFGDVSVLLGIGDGTFKSVQHFDVGRLPEFVAVGDFNGDGLDDLAVTCTPFTPGVFVLLSVGDGTFLPAQRFDAGITPTQVAVGDFNADGRPDLAVTNNFAGTGRVSVLLGNGDGTFQPSGSFGGPYSGSVAVGDFNGDGLSDLAVAMFQSPFPAGRGSVFVLLGTGDGTFRQKRPGFVAGDFPSSVAVGDFNGDGLSDLAVANAGSSFVSVFLGNGDGTFQPAQNFGVASARSFSVAIGDFNGDGLPDLAVANYDSDNVSVLINEPSGAL